MASATPDNPNEPRTAASVQRELDSLALRNTHLVEQYNHAQVVVTKYERQAAAARRAAARANAAFGKARRALGATITAQYEGGAFSATGALLSSESGTSYLDTLNTLSMMNTHTTGVLDRIAAAEKAAVKADKRAKALLHRATEKRDALVERKAEVQRQITKYTDLLDSLTAPQQAAYIQTQAPAVAPSAAPPPTVYAGGSAAARKAVQFALAQLGKPYVFGAAGPYSYDCSGLTMASWAAAGVSLPHSAADQYGYGTHVSLDALKPGDLVFMYQPIGHVTIYIGNGMMVSAPQTGDVVKIVPVSAFNGSIVGATRLV